MKDRFSDYFEGPTVVVMLERLESARPLGLADEARLSRETVRTQIKSLYAKLDRHPCRARGWRVV